MLQTLLKLQHKPFPLQKRTFFHWLNIVFNRVDEDRVRQVGADRVCAEWLLKNGASVKLNISEDYITDYNKLPPEETKLHITEIDATDASIMHYGFPHFVGCNHINRIKFHKCYYLENEALKELQVLRSTLQFLQISECFNITEKGLIFLGEFIKLKELILQHLPYVKDKQRIVEDLRRLLPNCNIDFK